MVQLSETEGVVASRASGRFGYNDLLSYRASGRFHSGFDRDIISYRGSERGVETLAYRASGRFDSGGVWGGSLLRSETLELDEQTIAYRASGRFNGGLDRYVISYRGSERGVNTLA